MCNKIVVGFLCLFFGSSLAMAESEDAVQGNVFSGSIELGGYKTSGNTETRTFDGKLELGHKLQQWSSKFTLEATQVMEDAVVTSDYYDAILKSIYDLPVNYYVFIKLGYREDTFSGVYYEKTYIGGLGYHMFADEPKYSVDLELGYGQRITKKLVNGVIRRRLEYDPGTHIAILGQYNFSEEDTIKINLTGEFGNDDDYINKEYSWEHKLFDAFKIDLAYEARTLTKPGVNAVATDSKTTIKLGYEF